MRRPRYPHALRPRPAFRAVTASLRALPDFLVIGAQRAGTTSLYDSLIGHPHVRAATHKELHYFDLRPRAPRRWYRARFPLERPGRRWLTGEASPYYLYHPAVPGRVAAALPDAKLIALLREPGERAYSHYRHMRRLRLEPLATFEEALDQEPARLAGEEERLLADPSYTSHAHRHWSYLARGHYADQIEHWLTVVPRDQFLVVRSEAFFADTQATYERVLDFLGLPRWTPPQHRRRNAGADRAPLAAATRERLDREFATSNERLFDLLGKRFW